ncbi:MAG: S9 family peptidase, partial [Chloroflexi bacterium]|nr:S9 family peptidase [Chloroflexota bacterium]
MTQPTIAPYGSWKSPITSDLIVARSVALLQIALDGDGIYWIEQRPEEGGRNVIVRRTPDGQQQDVNRPPFNARTRVHEYGGGAFAVEGGTVYFSNFADQRLHRQDRGAAPQPLTPPIDLRYADGVIDRRRGRLIAVREDHTVAGREAVNTIASVDLEGDELGGTVLVGGNDFYSTPSLNLDGMRLAWLTWNHPHMPWDGNELWVAEFADDGSLRNATRVAGGGDESIFQPQWSPDGTLYFVSDRSGWWNLYRWRDGRSESLCEMAAEFGEPQWSFGRSTYAFESARYLLCTYRQRGVDRLARLDTELLTLETIDIPFSEISSLHATANQAVFIGGSATEPASVVRLDTATRRWEVLRRASDARVDAGYVSVPEPVEFPTEHGQTAFGFLYRPRNRDYVAPDGEKPPLLVKVHGGPTGATSPTLNLRIQYWTSRGFAVFDVNYGGSTGYGTAYRRRLNGQWGVVDVDDTVNGTRYLVERGEADSRRLAIDGG